MTKTYQPAGCLTIRDAATREILATPKIGSRSVMINDMRGTLRDLRDTAIQGWVHDELERIAREGGKEGGKEACKAFLDREVIVADEYRY